MIEECGFTDESPEKKLFLNTCAGIYRTISDEMTKAELIGKRQNAAPLLDSICSFALLSILSFYSLLVSDGVLVIR